jgi:tetratricopeptide (TPR) repeat protein
VRGDFAGALADVDSAIATHPDRHRREALVLQRCDLLAFHLDRPDEAVARLREAVAENPGGRLAWWARTRLAVLVPSSEATVEDRLRVIHMDERAPEDVAAAAMYARARALDDAGDHRGASDLYWRLTQRFPDREPALAAPLQAIASEMARGDRERARQALARARDYYLTVLERGSASIEPRFLPADCLIEAYLALGDTAGASEALEGALNGVSGEGRLVLRVKRAAIERFLLGHPEKSVDILEKALVLDAGSRYARCVRWELERIREALNAQSG